VGLLFNYLGQFDRVAGEGEAEVQVAGEDSGRVRGARVRRAAEVEVNGVVAEGRLRVRWNYNPRRQRRETIERVAGWYVEALREVIAESRRGEVAAYVPSDFPMTELDEQSLDEILSSVKFES
jgi:microcystin synthetase protein McyA